MVSKSTKKKLNARYKTEKTIAIFFKNSQSKCWLNCGIYGVNSHGKLNVKMLHTEMIHFH